LLVSIFFGLVHAFHHRSVGSNSIKNSLSYSTNRIRLESQPVAPKIEDPIRTIDDKEEDDDNDESDVLVDALTFKLAEMEGLWYSDDFYGSHGREWVKVSAKLVGETASSALVAVKVTGDPNVPAGCITYQTKSWPSLGEKVAAEIQVRADPTDPDGFSWLPGELTLIAKNEIRLMCYYNPFARSVGSFFRQNDDESEEGCDDENDGTNLGE